MGECHREGEGNDVMTHMHAHIEMDNRSMNKLFGRVGRDGREDENVVVQHSSSRVAGLPCAFQEFCSLLINGRS